MAISIDNGLYDPPGSGGYVPLSNTSGSSSGSSTASTNATSVKALGGKLYSILASNLTAASIRYLKFYDKASAPTVGTDTPILTIPLPAAACTVIALGSYGITFSTGIAYAITGAIADSDTTAIGAGDIKLVLNYL